MRKKIWILLVFMLIVVFTVFNSAESSDTLSRSCSKGRDNNQLRTLVNAAFLQGVENSAARNCESVGSTSVACSEQMGRGVRFNKSNDKTREDRCLDDTLNAQSAECDWIDEVSVIKTGLVTFTLADIDFGSWDPTLSIMIMIMDELKSLKSEADAALLQPAFLKEVECFQMGCSPTTTYGHIYSYHVDEDDLNDDSCDKAGECIIKEVKQSNSSYDITHFSDELDIQAGIACESVESLCQMELFALLYDKGVSYCGKDCGAEGSIENMEFECTESNGKISYTCKGQAEICCTDTYNILENKYEIHLTVKATARIVCQGESLGSPGYQPPTSGGPSTPGPQGPTAPGNTGSGGGPSTPPPTGPTAPGNGSPVGPSTPGSCSTFYNLGQSQCNLLGDGCLEGQVCSPFPDCRCVPIDMPKCEGVNCAFSDDHFDVESTNQSEF